VWTNEIVLPSIVRLAARLMGVSQALSLVVGAAAPGMAVLVMVALVPDEQQMVGVGPGIAAVETLMACSRRVSAAPDGDRLRAIDQSSAMTVMTVLAACKNCTRLPMA